MSEAPGGALGRGWAARICVQTAGSMVQPQLPAAWAPPHSPPVHQSRTRAPRGWEGTIWVKALHPPSGWDPSPTSLPLGSPYLPCLTANGRRGTGSGVLEAIVTDPSPGRVTHSREQLEGPRGVTIPVPGAPATKWRDRTLTTTPGPGVWGQGSSQGNSVPFSLGPGELPSAP